MEDSFPTGPCQSSLADCSSLEDLDRSSGIAFCRIAANSAGLASRNSLTASSFGYRPIAAADHCNLSSDSRLGHCKTLCDYHYSHQGHRHGQ